MNLPAKIVVGALVGLMLVGCLKAPPVPVDKFYRLPDPHRDALRSGADNWGSLVYVSVLQANGLHTERAVLFSEDRHAVSLERYHYHHWVDGPPKLVQEYLAASLRRALPGILVLTEREGRADLVVSGKVKRFEHHVPGGEGPGKVMVALELRASRGDGAGPLWVKDYQSSEDVQESNMAATVDAFGVAVSSIVDAFLAELGSALSR